MKNLKELAKSAFNILLNILFPSICINCFVSIEDQNNFLCKRCFDLIILNHSFFCPVCMARRSGIEKICHPDCPYVLAPASFYASPIPSLIHTFKYQKIEGLKNHLSALLITYFKNLNFDPDSFRVTFVPLHFWKESRRGFNQSKILAEIFSSYFSIPLTETLKRTKNTESQAKKKGLLRREENIKNCFRVINKEEVRGNNFILIDDVSTSGATLMEASRILKQSGATLLIAMLVMAGILTVSLATSKLVINEIVQSAQLDRAIVAFYGAESGIEKSLFQIRRQDYLASLLDGAADSLSNGSGYVLVGEDTEDVIYADLNQDQAYQLDLYEAGSLDALDNPIKSVRLAWQGVGSWLEVSWSSWTTAGVIEERQGVHISQASSPYVVQLFDAAAYLYSLRLIARSADVDNLEITAYSDVDPVAACDPLSSCQVPIPGRAAIKAIGEYPEGAARASKQAILVTLPQKSPLSAFSRAE